MPQQQPNQQSKRKPLHHPTQFPSQTSELIPQTAPILNHLTLKHKGDALGRFLTLPHTLMPHIQAALKRNRGHLRDIAYFCQKALSNILICLKTDPLSVTI